MRRDFDPFDAAKELFLDLSSLLTARKAEFQAVGVKMTLLEDGSNEKAYLFRLGNGRALSAGFGLSSTWGYDRIAFRYGWHSSSFGRESGNSANDFFVPSVEPGESEDYVSTVMGAVMTGQNPVPKSQFLEAFWDFICRKLAQLDQ